MGLFDIWKKYVKINIATTMEYRRNFIIQASANLLANVLAVVFFWAIFEKIPKLNGWEFGQIVFMLGLLRICTGLTHVFLFGPSPSHVSDEVRHGGLDRFIVSPLNVLTHLIIHKIDDDGLGELFGAILMFIYGSQLIGLTFTIESCLLLGLMVFGGIMILFSLRLIIATISFWTTKIDSIEGVFNAILILTEYPITIFGKGVMFLMTFILPLGFIAFYPAQIFLGTGLYLTYAYLTPVVGVVMFVIAYSFWKFGLKNYASVGH